jgi:retron-type reverse transcriptase
VHRGNPLWGLSVGYRRCRPKLHRWAAADPGRRFDDLFNFGCDPATLWVAFDRVAGNHGANTPGVDGLTATMSRNSSGCRGSWTICEPV